MSPIEIDPDFKTEMRKFMEAEISFRAAQIKVCAVAETVTQLNAQIKIERTRKDVLTVESRLALDFLTVELRLALDRLEEAVTLLDVARRNHYGT